MFSKDVRLLTTTLFQFFNLILVVALLTVPVIITVLLLRHYSNKEQPTIKNEDYLIQKIRELENRIEELENK